MDGIVGIPEERALNEGRLVRPFLGLSKDLLLSYAKKHKLDFITIHRIKIQVLIEIT